MDVVSIAAAGDRRGQGERWLWEISGKGHGLGMIRDLVSSMLEVGGFGCPGVGLPVLQR